MAGLQLNRQLKVAGSSIIEVVIAMVVIVLVFSIAMAIFANVQRLSLSGKKIREQAILEQVLAKAKQSPDVSKESLTIDGINVDQDITVYNNSNNLRLVILVIYDNNHQVESQLKEVIYDTR